jgi:hypothetical protein
LIYISQRGADHELPDFCMVVERMARHLTEPCTHAL